MSAVITKTSGAQLLKASFARHRHEVYGRSATINPPKTRAGPPPGGPVVAQPHPPPLAVACEGGGSARARVWCSRTAVLFSKNCGPAIPALPNALCHISFVTLPSLKEGLLPSSPVAAWGGTDPFLSRVGNTHRRLMRTGRCSRNGRQSSTLLVLPGKLFPLNRQPRFQTARRDLRYESFRGNASLSWINRTKADGLPRPFQVAPRVMRR